MSDITTERLVLAALVKNEEYLRKLLPYIKEEYFIDETEKRVFKKINEYGSKYNECPDKSTLVVNTQNDLSMSEGDSERTIEAINQIYAITPSRNYEWLEKTTEEFCQNKAVFNAIQKSIEIYNGEENNLTVAAIPDILSQAISTSFDRKIGLDYFDDAAYRFEFYSNPEEKVPFRLSAFNDITSNGVVRKTLNILVAGVNVGKTLGLVSLSADYMRDGLNVLYISGEMREELIMNRVDANLLGVAVNDVGKMNREKFTNRVEALKQKSYGRLVVKEFAPGTATAVQIRNTLDELKMKKKFIPDVIVCDYLQIMASYRMRYGQQNSYFYFKAVAEELRALAVETNSILWSACQFNRGGMNASDVGMEDIAESTAIAQTADGMWALIRTEELDEANQLLVKQLKSRYADKAVKLRFVIGVDVNTQTLYDLDDDRAGDFAGSEVVKAASQTDVRDKFLNLK